MIVTSLGACTAKHQFIEVNLSAVIDPFTTDSASHPANRSSGSVMFWDVDHDLLDHKKFAIGHDFVSLALGCLLVEATRYIGPHMLSSIVAG
jgi:hypothetical protein